MIKYGYQQRRILFCYGVKCSLLLLLLLPKGLEEAWYKYFTKLHSQVINYKMLSSYKYSKNTAGPCFLFGVLKIHTHLEFCEVFIHTGPIQIQVLKCMPVFALLGFFVCMWEQVFVCLFRSTKSWVSVGHIFVVPDKLSESMESAGEVNHIVNRLKQKSVPSKH